MIRSLIQFSNVGTVFCMSDQTTLATERTIQKLRICHIWIQFRENASVVSKERLGATASMGHSPKILVTLH